MAEEIISREKYQREREKLLREQEDMVRRAETTEAYQKTWHERSAFSG